MTTRESYVLRTAEERRVRFVRLWFVDVLGALKSVAVPVSDLEVVLEDGIAVDGSALEGAIRARERDAIAVPDADTFELLPWSDDVGRMFCGLHRPGGTTFPLDSRSALERVLAAASDLGRVVQVGAEVEFFLFSEDADVGEPRPLDHGAYLDLTPHDEGADWRGAIIDQLEHVGIPVNASHHEVAPSQHEIHLAHSDALTMADALVTFRLLAKEVASARGAFASFMPKPLADHAGSGMHLHISLFDGSRNVFWDPDPETALSHEGRMFLAGVLAHARELALLTNQWVNSYKRLAAGFEAPSQVAWTRTSGSTLVRVPSARPERELAARIELRSPDPGANPYLSLAMVIAAGLRGIERGYELDREDRSSEECAHLPADLREALEVFDASELARETLGDSIVDALVANKRSEWRSYMAEVSSWELDRFLRRL